MAKSKTKPKKTRSGRRVEPDTGTKLPVAFSNVSIGDKTCRVGITISRGNMTLAQADKQFCDKRLTGTIRARDAQHDQEALPGMEIEEFVLYGAFDVKGYGVSAKTFSCGLTFAKESIDVETLANFAKRDGFFEIQAAADIPHEAPATAAAEEDEEDEE